MQSSQQLMVWCTILACSPFWHNVISEQEVQHWNSQALPSNSPSMLPQDGCTE